MKRPKILIIEDDTPHLEAISEKFRDEQFEVLTAQNGKEGLEKAFSSKPDIILLDVIMPMMDGVEVLNHYRAEGGAAPVIMLTNMGDDERRNTAQKLGAVDYLIKSDVSLHDVVEKVRKLLQ